MDGSMRDHLGTERISGLLDEPWADLEAHAHLEGCEACRAEFERLSRLRMALSALGDLDPPAGEWTAIEAALDREGVGASTSLARRRAMKLMGSGPLQAVAALALFAGGVLAGLQFTDGSDGVVPSALPPAVVSATGEDRMLVDGLTQLESLGAPLRQTGLQGDVIGGAGAPDGAYDFLAAAERALRLEAAIETMRQRLEDDPGDPVASAFLVQYVEERARLAEEIERSLGTRGTVTW